MKEIAQGIANEVLAAEKRIRPYIRRTYLEFSASLSQLADASVYLKLENLQATGSFKARGALNKLLSMSEDERARGCVAASTGNHGAAISFGLRQLNVRGVIFVPENVSQAKVKAIQQLGGIVRFEGSDSAETEAHARNYAADKGMTYVSPYNDLQVIAGQGTIGREIEHQLSSSRPDVIIASLGGGGLLSGIAGYLKASFPAVHILGCSPVNSQVMIQSVRAGHVLNLASMPTLSDGTAGGVEQGAITLEYCRALVDDYETATEKEIANAMRYVLENHHLLIEGAAGVAVAAYLKRKQEFRGKNVVIVICGGNISLDKLRYVLQQ